MALASTYSATVEGIGAHRVTVEANVGPGLPGMHIVGLGDKAVGESRDRIRTAVANSTLPWPRTKVMVSLSPANLPKSGSQFDLAVALAVLASMDPRAQHRLARSLIVGELGLGGQLRRVDGILQIILEALHRDSDSGDEITEILIPAGNAEEAALIGHPSVKIARTLTEAWQWVTGEQELPGLESVNHTVEPVHVPDFRDIVGQEVERRAMEVAAAGAHHVLMIGSPGSGKSMLAERLPSILPDLTPQQVVEATAIHSISGNSTGEVIVRAPFVAPHPSLGRAALIGGGSGIPRPGAVSHAHHGVLFLDEVSEIDATTLDALRVLWKRAKCACHARAGRWCIRLLFSWSWPPTRAGVERRTRRNARARPAKGLITYAISLGRCATASTSACPRPRSVPSSPPATTNRLRTSLSAY